MQCLFELCTPRTHGAPDSERQKQTRKQKKNRLENKSIVPCWTMHTPPPQKIFWNFHPKMVSFGAIWSAICNISQPAFTRKLKLQQHTVRTIIPLMPICLTYSFWSVKPAAYYYYLFIIKSYTEYNTTIWVLTSSCTVFVPFRDSA